MSFIIATASPLGPLATGGTLTFQYPVGRTAADFAATGAIAWFEGLETKLLEGVGRFTLSYGANNITLTYLGATTVPANSRVSIQCPFSTGAQGITPRVIPVADTALTLSETAHGNNIIVCENTSALAITVPIGISPGTSVLVMRFGSADVTIAGEVGLTLVDAYSKDNLTAVGQAVTIVYRSPTLAVLL